MNNIPVQERSSQQLLRDQVKPWTDRYLAVTYDSIEPSDQHNGDDYQWDQLGGECSDAYDIGAG